MTNFVGLLYQVQRYSFFFKQPFFFDKIYCVHVHNARFYPRSVLFCPYEMFFSTKM
jgi:hypothetical protein